MRCSARSILVPILLSGAFSLPGLFGPADMARAETVTHVEDFTSRILADTVLTTAAWDTVAGTLHLTPQGLTDLDVLDLTGESRAVARVGDIALVAIGSANAVAVIDAADPANLSFVKTHPLPAEGRHIVVAGNTAYVALGGGLGFQVLDVTNPASPVTGVRVTQTGYTSECVVAGGWIYSVLSAAGIGVADRADPASPVAGPAVSLGAWVRALAVDGGHLYAGNDNKLTVLSLAAPGTPAPLASVTVSGTALSVAVADGWAYVGGSFGVDVLDVSTPGSPLPRTTVDLGGGAAYNIAVRGDSLIVANGTGGLQVVDVSDPLAPVVVGERLSADYFYHTLPDGAVTWAANGASGLRALKVDAQGLDPTRNVAVSQNLNPGGEPISRVRLAVTDTDSIAYAISGNGTTWLPLPADDTWLDLDPPLTGLRWRATLVQTGPWPGPVCENLTLVYDRLHNYAEITAIDDVAGDAGGQVRVRWLASRFDAPAQGHLVTSYSLYRRFDGNAATPAAAYPPGDWEFLLTVPADQEAEYAATAPTVADSSGSGPAWTAFFVRARTDTAGLFFDSPPDSGYSVDDSAPAPPTGLVIDRFADHADLSWDPSADPDFAHFRVYRLPSPLLDPAPAYLFAVTVQTTWTDQTDVVWHYALTQVNTAGDESPPAAQPVAVPPGPVTGGRIGRAVPNPFNPATRIAYSVGAGGGPVRLEVLDARGLLVATLVDAWRPAGDHAVTWRGRDSQGRNVASGIYTCRLRCGSEVSTRKMTLLR